MRTSILFDKHADFNTIQVTSFLLIDFLTVRSILIKKQSQYFRYIILILALIISYTLNMGYY